MLATGSQLARRSLGILRQQLEHHVQLIEHVLIRHHWALEFLKTRNSKLDTGDISPLFGLKTCSTDFQTMASVLAGSMGTVGLGPLEHADLMKEFKAFQANTPVTIEQVKMVVSTAMKPLEGSLEQVSTYIEAAQ